MNAFYQLLRGKSIKEIANYTDEVIRLVAYVGIQSQQLWFGRARNADPLRNLLPPFELLRPGRL